MSDERPPRGAYLAIGLVSCAVLLFEVLITRVLSVVLWYHFVFLSVSLAMLGLGAPGVWFALRPPGARTLSRTLLLGALNGAVGTGAPDCTEVYAQFGGQLAGRG